MNRFISYSVDFVEVHETRYFNDYDDHGPNVTGIKQVVLELIAYSYVDNSNYPIIDDAEQSVYNSYGGPNLRGPP